MEENNFPTLEQIKKADRLQICKWYRFLCSPENDSERLLLNIIIVRFEKFGGFTPEISKEIGW